MHIFQRSPKSNLQNDLESHQATIEFQILMAYQTYIFSNREPNIDFQNDLEAQQATAYFQILMAYNKYIISNSNVRVWFPEWHWVATRRRLISDPDGTQHIYIF